MRTRSNSAGKPQPVGKRFNMGLEPGQPQSISQKLIPLKQLKDMIADIYNQKLKFDAKSRQSGLPIETMEQFMYTYLV